MATTTNDGATVHEAVSSPPLFPPGSMGTFRVTSTETQTFCVVQGVWETGGLRLSNNDLVPADSRFKFEPSRFEDDFVRVLSAHDEEETIFTKVEKLMQHKAPNPFVESTFRISVNDYNNLPKLLQQYLRQHAETDPSKVRSAQRAAAGDARLAAHAAATNRLASTVEKGPHAVAGNDIPTTAGNGCGRVADEHRPPQPDVVGSGGAAEAEAARRRHVAAVEGAFGTPRSLRFRAAPYEVVVAVALSTPRETCPKYAALQQLFEHWEARPDGKERRVSGWCWVFILFVVIAFGVIFAVEVYIVMSPRAYNRNGVVAAL